MHVFNNLFYRRVRASRSVWVNMAMLLVWNGRLMLAQQEQIRSIDALASYWPRAWGRTNPPSYNEAIPTEWWISFSHGRYGLIWCLRYPDVVEIIYRD